MAYIRYFPRENCFHKSRVSCIRFDTTKCPTIETTSETASGTASGTTYINNITSKQYPEKNKNGMEKISGGHFYVDNEKIMLSSFVSVTKLKEETAGFVFRPPNSYTASNAQGIVCASPPRLTLCLPKQRIIRYKKSFR